MTKAKDLLENWGTLNTGLQSLTEKQVEKLLQMEKEGQRRLAFLIRIYGRYNTLRTIRERNELAGG